jgi:hypothetical protein
LFLKGRVAVSRNETVEGLRILVGRVENHDVELVTDADGKAVRGKCRCSHTFRFKLRAGPCRHMQALRRKADDRRPSNTLEQWYRRLTTEM